MSKVEEQEYSLHLFDKIIYFSRNPVADSAFHILDGTHEHCPAGVLVEHLVYEERLKSRPDGHYAHNIYMSVFCKVEVDVDKFRLEEIVRGLNREFVTMKKSKEHTFEQIYIQFLKKYPSKMYHDWKYQKTGLPKQKVPHTKASGIQYISSDTEVSV